MKGTWTKVRIFPTHFVHKKWWMQNADIVSARDLAKPRCKTIPDKAARSRPTAVYAKHGINFRELSGTPEGQSFPPRAPRTQQDTPFCSTTRWVHSPPNIFILSPFLGTFRPVLSEIYPLLSTLHHSVVNLNLHVTARQNIDRPSLDAAWKRFRDPPPTNNKGPFGASVSRCNNSCIQKTGSDRSRT